MDTIKQLSEYAKAKNITDITFMGVPKTIDNDLAVTDHTPGYGSAAKYIASTMKEIIRDALVQPIKIVNIIEMLVGLQLHQLLQRATIVKVLTLFTYRKQFSILTSL